MFGFISGAGGRFHRSFYFGVCVVLHLRFFVVIFYNVIGLNFIITQNNSIHLNKVNNFRGNDSIICRGYDLWQADHLLGGGGGPLFGGGGRGIFRRG